MTASDGADPEPDDEQEEEEKELEDALEADDDIDASAGDGASPDDRSIEGDSSTGRIFVMTDPLADDIRKEDIVHEAAEVPEVHHRELPGILGQIAGRLGYNGEFVAFAEESDEEMLDYLCQVMKSSWEKQMMDGKDKMFSIFDRHLSVIIASPKMVWDSIRKEELLNNAGAVMYSKHAESWHALVLILDEGYELQHAEEIAISPSSFSPSNWKICTNIGELLIQRGR